jgi:hypothetical protein
MRDEDITLTIQAFQVCAGAADGLLLLLPCSWTCAFVIVMPVSDDPVGIALPTCCCAARFVLPHSMTWVLTVKRSMLSLLPLSQISVSMYTTTARKLLRKYDGYECKEPEPGKFTLAFK